jgi:formate-dependent nitrite reductase membrane component NrfD
MDTNGSLRTVGSSLADHPYAGETYYGQPAVKQAPFEWMSAVYLFASGLAGGAQLIATLIRRFGAPRLQPVVRNGRYLALAGAATGPLLLITDLKTPRRWYNMLRIFRKTSPMSLGSYLLTSFGVSSLLAAWDETRARGPSGSEGARATRIIDIPAAMSAAGLSTYTGALLASTSTPLWSTAPRLLAARFASSAFATGAAALSLAEHASGRYASSATLDLIAAVATAAHVSVSLASERAYAQAGVAAPLRTGRAGAANKASLVLGGALPLICYAAIALGARPARKLSMFGAIGILAGGLLMRFAYHEGGKVSATRPRDYFGITQPQRTGQTHTPMPLLAVPSNTVAEEIA